MSAPIAGVFTSEASLRGAVELLRLGRGRGDVCVMSHDALRDPSLTGSARCVTVKDLREPGEMQLRMALRGALWGSIVGIVVSAVAAFILFEPASTRMLVFGVAWKLGTFIGVYVGMFIGAERGLPREVAGHYLEHLAHHRLVLVARSRHDAVNVRGILLESGAVEVRDVKGTFEAVPVPEPPRHVPAG